MTHPSSAKGYEPKSTVFGPATSMFWTHDHDHICQVASTTFVPIMLTTSKKFDVSWPTNVGCSSSRVKICNLWGQHQKMQENVLWYFLVLFGP